MKTVALARNAMATRFEIVLHGENPVSLRAAGEEALQEIERLEGQLSLYRPASEIAHLNARAAREPVRVTPALFTLLRQAQSLSRETGGAFDITVLPLMRCWGFLAREGRRPSAEELSAVRGRVGMHLLELNESDYTVRFAREGVMLDLGAIGKGYAIEQAAGLLVEAGVTSALLHGGTSTVYALGSPPDADCWHVGVPVPDGTREVKPVDTSSGSEPDSPPLLTCVTPTSGRRTIRIPLKNQALSVSAIWGRFFQDAGETRGHILDPRTGLPATASSLALVAMESATESDALSTALLALGFEGHDRIANCRPGIRTLVCRGEGSGFQALSQGISPDLIPE